MDANEQAVLESVYRLSGKKAGVFVSVQAIADDTGLDSEDVVMAAQVLMNPYGYFVPSMGPFDKVTLTVEGKRAFG